MFDLKQALMDNGNKFDNSMLDNECFLALINTIGTITTSEIEQEQFYDWERVQFRTLFYGLEMWLRKNSTLAKSNTASNEAPAKVYCFIRKMNL
jgi:hypothetical protein